MKWYHWLGVAAVAVLIIGFFYAQNRLRAPVVAVGDLAQARVEAKAQNEAAFMQPKPQAAVYPDKNPLNNVYFGDLHAHSNLSFDSYIFGNRLTVDDSYRIAKGEAVENPVGEIMQLTRPLDFAAMTDHAEGFGLHEGCADPDLNIDARDLCARFENPDAKLFLQLRKEGEKRPPVSVLGKLTQDREKEQRFARSTWSDIVASADRHNDPGKFTTFAAYEYSPPLPDSGKIHRNVIFRNSHVPDYAVSAFHALTEIDLWKQVSNNCDRPCEFLTIPHNPNKSWGLAFASHTIDGDPYTADDWKLRDKVEPIVEMFQIKGNSECSVGFGTSDEECNFEQFFPRCEEDQDTKCISSTSMARDGLKKGLQLRETIGLNPLAFGMIGSTDTHNSNPGDTEEWDFRGPSAVFSAPAKKRIHSGRSGVNATVKRNPGGMAAIWAVENTRDALFDAMKRKEVYATSGTRISLRFFGSFAFDKEFASTNDALARAYNIGVPMGGKLVSGSETQPTFFIWAVQDPLDAPLDKVQIVKGWIENGETKEQVWDIVCSEERTVDPETGRCAAINASVDLTNCAYEKGRGASELKTVWADTTFDTGQRAFYYVRVIQNPTCRWSTYDSLRLGEAPLPDVPSTSTEMAWSSPIWVNSN